MWNTGKNLNFVHLKPGESRTVLVLGAGASAHLGFPLGPKLCSEIIQNTSDPNLKSFTDLLAMGFPRQIILSFHDQLDKSFPRSIDEFLSDRAEYIDVGRAVIAQVLTRHEDEKVLRSRDNNWYGLLRNLIRQDLDRNKFSPLIVTFNYDLSLYKFLYDFLSSTFQRFATMNTLDEGVRILHVHGRLGYLDFEKRTPSRTYARRGSPTDILEASRGIRVPSQLENDYGRDMLIAQEAIKQAKRVIFLGFGYDETNINRIRIDTWEPGKYFGTGYRLENKRIQELSTLSGKKLSLGDPVLGIYEYLISAACWNDD